MMNRSILAVVLVLAASGLGTILTGCGRPNPESDAEGPSVETHRHTPPHGGTPVMLGEGEYHLELLLDPATGRVQAYVLDGHLEAFVRSSTPAFTLSVELDGREESVELRAAANAATGETVGDTALFEGQADFLQGIQSFEGRVDSITIRGRSFENIRFRFPEGTIRQHD